MPVSGSLAGLTGRIRRRASLRCLPVIAGVLGGLAVETVSPLTLPVTAVIGVVMAVVVLVRLLAEQERR